MVELSFKERLLFVIWHMPSIVYENGLGPEACAELQIEVIKMDLGM